MQEDIHVAEWGESETTSSIIKNNIIRNWILITHIK